MDKYIMKKALIKNIVFDEFNKIDYINIFNANDNNLLCFYSEEMGSINIITCRIHSLVDYVEIDDIKASFNDLDNDIQRISCYSDLLMAFLKKNKRSEVKKLSFKNVIETIVKYYKILVDEYNISIDISNLQEFSCEIFMKQIDLESIIVSMLSNSFEALKGT